MLWPLMVAASLAGCQGGEQNYLVNGIGTELTAPNLARTESLQNQYFSYLCRQANSQPYVAGERCEIANWDLIVRQGMNDIDRRCDGYLQWLDNRKRSKGPWIAQIGDTAAATAAVLGQVDAGTKAITLVAQAFQLVTKSVENYHSRLLLEVESSTVHSIVLKGRYDFRTYLQAKGIHFSNKPDAEHALRSYTRLCLPFAIEAKINNFSTLAANNERPGADNTLGDLPVVGAVRASTPVFRPDRGAGTRNPAIEDQTVRRLQKALCVPADGKVGVQTKEAIRAYQYVNRQAETGQLSETAVDEIINTFGPGQPKQFGECDPQFRNFLERHYFNNDPGGGGIVDLREILRALAGRHGAAVEITDADTLATLRPKIEAIKQKIGGDVLRTGNMAFLNTQYTPDLDRLALPTQ
jgi:Putative peptidoglycan binding domain.